MFCSIVDIFRDLSSRQITMFTFITVTAEHYSFCTHRNANFASILEVYGKLSHFTISNIERFIAVLTFDHVSWTRRGRDLKSRLVFTENECLKNKKGKNSELPIYGCITYINVARFWSSTGNRRTNTWLETAVMTMSMKLPNGFRTFLRHREVCFKIDQL